MKRRKGGGSRRRGKERWGDEQKRKRRTRQPHDGEGAMQDAVVAKLLKSDHKQQRKQTDWWSACICIECQYNTAMRNGHRDKG